MDTPVIKLSLSEEETVYVPSEDSFLLIDALEADLELFRTVKSRLCLEIGSGSGVVITALAAALKKYCSSYFLATDINPHACMVTKKTSINNAVDIDVIQMDLVFSIRNKGVFDIIVFNPPYVVTESVEVYDKRLISKTWAGGIKGREVMEKIFAHIPILLSDVGIFYLVVIEENEPDYIMRIFRNFGMKGEIVADRKIRGEHLKVLRFVKLKQREPKNCEETIVKNG
ncbi:hemK methyltransferase family member 2 [Orussus abietinus]|uniref:hemK methyltransferase family member 2 n=1 Tax=Orussus abietinus TaxID=222816 RepID=UPI00062664FD|nr:hemK methyltransferase family member 2 [Orussus abietinus]